MVSLVHTPEILGVVFLAQTISSWLSCFTSAEGASMSQVMSRWRGPLLVGRGETAPGRLLSILIALASSALMGLSTGFPESSGVPSVGRHAVREDSVRASATSAVKRHRGRCE
ncbi:hypothetical protein BKH29_10210 [Actinomyces oris]|uniref:Uncharacterized protein n=1 Tax=Actinomyces oris TaxID=544580 RepID=A0A1Q8V5U1_9ACTO|nr:hypothetical protein BKH29_10210 [Actinomyces oris]